MKFNHKADYALQRQLLAHQDRLFASYSKLMMLRIDFAYLKEGDAFEFVDMHQIATDMTHLIEQVNELVGVVGFAWVLEYGKAHRFHIHAVFYINGQRYQRVWNFWQDIRAIWKAVTEGEGYAYHCTPQAHYRVQGERVIAHDDMRGRQGLQHVLKYLAKESQRTPRRVYQYSEVPEKQKGGRKRRVNSH
ncbi:hypothetical protein AB7Z81_15110 [Providencia manganoxydans]|uniref:hypothetical protein n=1 Tax=Providencia manganoxydans TaxID=2923283 RepID=UPI0034E414BF